MSEKTPLEKQITVLQVAALALAGLMVVINASWILGLDDPSLPPVEPGRITRVFEGILLLLLVEGGLEFVKRKWGR